MAIGNYSYSEAKEKIPSNTFQPLTDLDNEITFPQLHRRAPKTINNHEEITQLFVGIIITTRLPKLNDSIFLPLSISHNEKI